jgi:hypothetical protein
MSAQVLVEALRNSLKVEGLVATGMLDEALGITQPGISSSQQTAGVAYYRGHADADEDCFSGSDGTGFQLPG